MTEATEAHRIEKAVSEARNFLRTAKAEGQLRVGVEHIEFDLEQDQTGDPAVIVTVVLPDSIPDRDWTSENLEPIARELRKRIHAQQTGRWIYVRFTKLSAQEDRED